MSLHPAMPQWPLTPSSSSSAVAKGLLILWAVPGQGGRSPLAPTVPQTQALVRLMAEDAQELFTFYVSPSPGQGVTCPLHRADAGLSPCCFRIPDPPLQSLGRRRRST